MDLYTLWCEYFANDGPKTLSLSDLPIGSECADFFSDLAQLAAPEDTVTFKEGESEWGPKTEFIVAHEQKFTLYLSDGVITFWKGYVNNMDFVRNVVDIQKELATVGRGNEEIDIGACSANMVHMAPGGLDFTEEEEAATMGRNHTAIRATQRTLPEVIADEAKEAGLSVAVKSTYFKLNLRGRIHLANSTRGVGRDNFTDLVQLPRAAVDANVGNYVEGSSGVYRVLQRISCEVAQCASLKEVVPSLQLINNVSVLSNVAMLFACDQLAEYTSELELSDDVLGRVLVKTDKVTIKRGLLWGVSVDVRNAGGAFTELMKLLEANRTYGGKMKMLLREDGMFDNERSEATPDMVHSADCMSAIEYALQGENSTALFTVAAWYLKEQKSQYAAHLIESSAFSFDETVDSLIGDALAYGGVGENVHLAIYKDAKESISKKNTRIPASGGIRVSPRGQRRVGCERAKKRILTGKKRLKMQVEVRNSKVVGKIKNIPMMTKRALSVVTGINIMDMVEISLRPREVDIEQDDVMHSLLQGNFGKDGFEWALDAILSNGVKVNKRSRSISYLPENITVGSSGLLINEPLEGEVLDWVAVVTKDDEVFIDWGPEFGLRRVVVKDKPLLKCVSTSRSRQGIKRCRLGDGYLLGGERIKSR